MMQFHVKSPTNLCETFAEFIGFQKLGCGSTLVVSKRLAADDSWNPKERKISLSFHVKRTCSFQWRIYKTHFGFEIFFSLTVTPIFLKIPYDFSFTLTEKLFGRVRRLAAVYEELSFDDDVPRSAVGDVDDGGLLRHNVKQHPPTIPARLLNCAPLLTQCYQIDF